MPFYNSDIPVRANQRDLYHVAQLRDLAENVLRYWLGSRWLARWDKELDLLVKLLYFGLTSGRGKASLFALTISIISY